MHADFRRAASAAASRDAAAAVARERLADERQWLEIRLPRAPQA
jgi:hypothetical protein